MVYKTLIFGTDGLYSKLKPLYKAEVKRGNLEIVATIDDISKLGGGNIPNFDLAIVSSKGNLYQRMKRLEGLGVPRNKIIDGRVFQMPELDFPRFLKERIAYGVFEKNAFDSNSRMIYPKVYVCKTKNSETTLSLGIKSYIRPNSSIEGKGSVSLGKFSSFAKNIFFSLGQNHTHNYSNVGTVPATSLDWNFPKEFLPARGPCKIFIGNDVWCGHRSVFKCTNPNKPLVIGDGAVIASDSVVVKNVPPYAIVGGNP
ncbi:MAG: hypothetical protein J5497_06450, partial [Selenomonadaceae bacterium]|nr:hypothetical protein [Selenomonadaceae bacterium]